MTPHRLETLAEVPVPEPGPIEVLVRVRAAGINPVDWKTRRGAGVRGFFDASSPMVLGWDVATEGAVAEFTLHETSPIGRSPGGLCRTEPERPARDGRIRWSR
jgi:D-arabinose 1-dehydrogenase-like Zn-dependent alcohol dehydrogenase